MSREKTLSVTIDNRKLEARPGWTILETARENGIYVPSLCTWRHLPSYGACRLCVVEVDGLRGFPTSCTTPVEDGMVIRTDTAEIRTLRQEVLKLLLSEHPASCLFCDEKGECQEFQGTIRKVGMTTGCRYCPNDTQCELQQVVEAVGLTEASYKVYYRNFPVEKYDPFYDRDYNLCLLCGRCVRVCNNVRQNGTLSFKRRGRYTTIGPAFDRTHLEAGCEFCGACVNACPTGALSTKYSKWLGKPDAEVETTCVYCPVGCQIRLQVKNGEVIDVFPDYASPVDHGLICVKGRFAIPEYVHNPSRLTMPAELTPLGYNQISWDEALEKAAEQLKAAGPEGCLMVVSPQLSNEDFFVAQQLARDVLGTDDIVSSAMVELGEDFLPFLDLAMRAEGQDAIDGADAVLAVGFDSLYGFSPVGVGTKKAAERGAAVATLGVLDSNIDLQAELSVKANPSLWADFLEEFFVRAEEGPAKGARKGRTGLNGEVDAVTDLFAGRARTVIIAGPQIMSAPERRRLLAVLARFRDALSWKIVLAHPYTNLLGMAVMGAVKGLKPGQILGEGSDGPVPVAVRPVDLTKRRKVIYLIGEEVSAGLPECDFLIYQNALPSRAARRPDLVLPASLFPESAGTLINGGGRMLEIKKAILSPGEARPDWWVFVGLAGSLGHRKGKYKDIAGIHAEIKKQVKGFPFAKKRIEFPGISYPERAKAKRPSHGATSAAYPFLLFWKPDQDRYRGVALAEVVEGMKLIGNRGRLVVSHEDALRLGVTRGETVNVSSNGYEAEFPVAISTIAVPGTVHLLSAATVQFDANPCPVQIRRNHE